MSWRQKKISYSDGDQQDLGNEGKGTFLTVKGSSRHTGIYFSAVFHISS